MILPKNNLVAIAYKTGYCGSLIYALTAMSPEVAKYKPFDKLTFNDSTAHEAKENWFNNLHDYNDSLGINEKDWPSHVPPETQAALQNDQLILFRCHPNTAHKLSFIENLRVLYLTHKNKYIPERWAYEKVYKPQSETFYQKNLQKLLDTQKTVTITNQLKRIQLIKNLNHHVVTWEQIVDRMQTSPYLVEIDQILEKNYSCYTDLCSYLQITPLAQDAFQELINRYNSKQWKRF